MYYVAPIYHFGPDLALSIYIFQYLALFTNIYPHLAYLALFGYAIRQLIMQILHLKLCDLNLTFHNNKKAIWCNKFG